ncbi:HNH endonuclease [Tumebacillus permanentifrigoris]|uniref:HNH endonuclease n=1 Tax=Tumebacillus permanentifrigoris TaxID=378543 RepID=A0A316D6X0_9BACL|nr:HNH endonuclease [Tumebacillus permanentifrigoris]PWK10197.1 hypothetical protein C7459_11218 [Tumebacillus permanentifrigoris]
MLSAPRPAPKPRHGRNKPKAKDRGAITPEVAKEVIERADGRCEMCGRDRPSNYAYRGELAHLDQKGQCGRGDQPWNIAALCGPSTNSGTCHWKIDSRRKTYRDEVEKLIAKLKAKYDPADWPE